LISVAQLRVAKLRVQEG